MVVVFDKKTYLELLQTHFSERHIDMFRKGIFELRKELMVGDGTFFNYILTNIDGFCWEGKLGDVRPTLTVKFMCEDEEELTLKTIKTPYSIEGLSISMNLYDKIVSLKTLTEEEKYITVKVLSKVIDIGLNWFYNLLDVEPGVNIVEINRVMLLEECLVLCIGE